MEYLYVYTPILHTYPIYIYISELCFFVMTRQRLHHWLLGCTDYRYQNSISMTSYWPRWRLKSPMSQLFAQSFARAQIKENIKAPRHWTLWGEIHRWQRASKAGSNSIWWRYRGLNLWIYWWANATWGNGEKNSEFSTNSLSRHILWGDGPLLLSARTKHTCLIVWWRIPAIKWQVSLVAIKCAYYFTDSSSCGAWNCSSHYYDVIMGAITSQIISLTIVYSTVYSDSHLLVDFAQSIEARSLVANDDVVLAAATAIAPTTSE